MPKVVATSDLHGTLPEIPDCDILLIGGDICPDFATQSYSAGFGYAARAHQGQERQAKWLDTTFREWLDALVERGIQVVAIAGNHDFVFEKHKFLLPELPWTYLQDSGVEIIGLKLWGTPWVPKLASWAFYASDAALEARSELIPTDLDILVSHGPPRGYGDFVDWDGHVGDVPLMRDLTRLSPKVIVCGHIHEGFGVYEHTPSNTVIYNVALNNEYYKPVNPPVEIVEFTYA